MILKQFSQLQILLTSSETNNKVDNIQTKFIVSVVSSSDRRNKGKVTKENYVTKPKKTGLKKARAIKKHVATRVSEIQWYYKTRQQNGSMYTSYSSLSDKGDYGLMDY